MPIQEQDLFTVDFWNGSRKKFATADAAIAYATAHNYHDLRWYPAGKQNGFYYMYDFGHNKWFHFQPGKVIEWNPIRKCWRYAHTN